MSYSTGLGKTVTKWWNASILKKKVLNSNLEWQEGFLYITAKMILATGKTKLVIFFITWKINLFRNKYSLMAFTVN